MFRNSKKFDRVYVYKKPTEEADRIAVLRVERQKMEKENRELSASLTEKRECIDFDIDVKENVEREHKEKIKSLIGIEEALDAIVNSLTVEEQDLRGNIVKLKKEQDGTLSLIELLKTKNLKLNKDIIKNINDYNIQKGIQGKIINGLREKIDKGNIELKRLNEQSKSGKEKLKQVIKKANEENKILSKKESDLKIYENRMRKHNPNIIL